MSREDNQRYPLLLWVSVVATLLGSFQFGYHLGVLNTCLSFVASDLGFDENREGSVVVSAALVGAAVGALLAGQIADALGPRKALALNNIPLLLGCLLCGATPGGLWAAIVGRVLAGLGAGSASLYVPRYLAEISPPLIRGSILTLNQVVICVGCLIAYVVGLPYIHQEPVFSHGVAWWRVMLFLGFIPAGVQLVSMLLLPESPIWLRWKGKPEEAEVAEQSLLGEVSKHGAESEPLVAAEEAAPAPESAAQLEEEVEGQEGGWLDLLQPKYRRIMLLAAFIPSFQQLSGVNTCILYSSKVFQNAGLAQPVLGSIIMGVVNTAATVLAVFLMDRAGRRLLLCISHAGMACCLLLIAITSFIPSLAASQAIIAVALLQVYILFYGLGVGPIPWCYLPEILPDAIRGRGASVGTCLNWVLTFLVGLTFPYMLTALKVGGSYLVYSVFNFVALAFCYLCMVETRRQTFAQIQAELIVQ